MQSHGDRSQLRRRWGTDRGRLLLVSNSYRTIGAMSAQGTPPSLRQAARVWTTIGINSFGGPAGQISVMHREVVDRQGWLDERRFVHALNYCLLLPGPEAQQLATYLGWLTHGVRGGLVAGSLFVIPGFAVMLALSVTYALYGDVDWISGLLFGLQAAVVAIVIHALQRIGTRLVRSPLPIALAAAAFLSLFVFAVPFPAVVIGAGVIGWALGAIRPEWLGQPAIDPAEEAATEQVAVTDGPAPSSSRRALQAAAWCAALWLIPLLALVGSLGTDHVFAQEALLFSQTAVIGFGGAYAILTYVSQEAVGAYGWLSARDMTTGLALAESTPGPLVLVLQFVGFMAGYNQPGSLPPLMAGCIGALIAVWVTFLPCFMFIFAGAPFVERLRHNRALHHALTGISAAVVGVIANLAAWFAITTLFQQTQTVTEGPLRLLLPVVSSLDVWAVSLALIAVVLIWRFHWSTLRVLAVCGGLGILISVIS